MRSSAKKQPAFVAGVIGDFETILFFQITKIPLPVLSIIF